MGIENHQKHSLGKRAFLLFLSKRIKLAIFFFVLTIAAWYSERWVPPDYLPFVQYAVDLLALFSVLYLLVVLLWTWMEYRFYTYTFTDEAFVMTYGYVMRTELAALYHQIQNVSIQRGPLDRIAGVSQVVIFMNGSERDAAHNKIILPAVGKTKARLVQKELLMRARRHVMGDNYPEAVREEGRRGNY
ncbi:MAG TPA: PH domain-containing protein [Candidatus Paceibacterota bacterium]|nr:PH domain-containing protein [Candidatus Paceibacterota bacterium]